MNGKFGIATGLLVIALAAGLWVLRSQRREIDRLRVKIAVNAAKKNEAMRTYFEGQARIKKIQDELGAAKKEPQARQKKAPVSGKRIPGTLPKPLADAFSDPQFVQAVGALAKLRLSETYGILFRSLHLSADVEGQFEDLLVAKQEAKAEVGQVAREAGDSVVSSIRQAIAGDQTSIDSQIRTLIGDDAFNQYTDYERSMRLRERVGDLQSTLSYSDEPLSDEKAEQVVQALYAASPFLHTGAPSGLSIVAAVGMTEPVTTVKLTDSAIAQASQLLSPGQLEALCQVQEQITAEELIRARRNGRADNP